MRKDSCRFCFRVFDCGENVRIRAATTKVAAHEFANFVVAVRVIFFQERDRGTDLSRRAVAALKSVVLNKRSLHRMQLVAVRDAFDGGDLIPFMHDRERKTGIDATTVYQTRAGAALTVLAALFRPCTLQHLAQSAWQGGASIAVS